MSAPSPLPILQALGFNFHRTLGSLLIGSSLSLFITGITSLQTYTYYRRSKLDASYFRAIIYGLWVLDLLDAGFLASAAYVYAERLASDPLGLLIPQWNFTMCLPLGALSDVVVAIIYVERIWRFSDKGLLVTVFVTISQLLSFVSLGASLAVFAISFKVSTYLEFASRYRWMWYTEFVCRACVDIMIAITLTILLKGRKSQVRSTTAIINFIIMYGINTGIIATAFSVAAIITYALIPESFIPFAVTACLPKLMLNSILSLMNSRQRFRDQSSRANFLSIQLSPAPPVLRRLTDRRDSVDIELGPVHTDNSATAVDSKGSTNP